MIMLFSRDRLLAVEAVNGFYLHYKAGTASKGVVIGLVVLIGGVVPYVVQMDIGKTGFLGACHH